jgi:hemerythrin-like domain-containing protein
MASSSHNGHDVLALLMQEHEVITKALDGLSAIGRGLLDHGHADPKALHNAIRFLKEFVDNCHHVKEERILFPALEEKGLPASVGPLFVLRGEHEEGRGLVRALEQATERYTADKRGSERAIAEAIREITRLYSQHIAKENEVLFPMASRLLSAHEQHELFEAFERVEAEGSADHDALTALATELERVARG